MGSGLKDAFIKQASINYPEYSWKLTELLQLQNLCKMKSQLMVTIDII